ncbi:glycosyltransferase family 2 protein [Kineococcus sp. SYSU DK003]|uniref:glycosyltransferase family 2 protein n=1 Tax=Kineococcus sp. SYSU DK003 TaxID=3383124 RepID=UPI003D7D026E
MTGSGTTAVRRTRRGRSREEEPVFAPRLVLEATSDSADPAQVTAAVVAAVRAASPDAAGPHGPDDEPYDGAYVLIRVAGVPLAAVTVRLPVSAEQVALAVRSAGVGRSHTPRPVVRAQRLPTATVVVPSIVSRVTELRHCLESLVALDHPATEVILVDNRPQLPADDPLPALLRGLPQVRVLHEPRPGTAAARNAGLRVARGEVIAFTDDDVRVDPGWLSALVRRFAEHPEEDAVTGLIMPSELLTPAQQQYEEYYGGFSGPRTFAPVSLHPAHGRRDRPRWGLVDVRAPGGERVRTFAVYGIGAYGAGANMAFRTERLRAVGGFDLRLGPATPTLGAEDLAVFVRLLTGGGVLGYEPTALVHHTHRRERAQLERQLVSNGTGFTALLTCLVLDDPRHLLALVRRTPVAGWAVAHRALTRWSAQWSQARHAVPPAYPVRPKDPHLVRLEVGGMLKGPAAYLRSRRAHAAGGVGQSTTTFRTTPTGTVLTSTGRESA